MARIKTVGPGTDTQFEYFRFTCPGCGHEHMIKRCLRCKGIKAKKQCPDCKDKFWQYNDDPERPTIQASILAHQVLNQDTGEIYIPRCHSFVTDGRIQFLEDCDHNLKGQTVDLPEIP